MSKTKQEIDREYDAQKQAMRQEQQRMRALGREVDRSLDSVIKDYDPAFQRALLAKLQRGERMTEEEGRRLEEIHKKTQVYQDLATPAKPTPTREEQFAIDKKRVIELQTKQLQGLIFTDLELEELLSIGKKYEYSAVEQERAVGGYILTLKSRNKRFKEGKTIYADGRHISPQVCGASTGAMNGLTMFDLEGNAALIGVPLFSALPTYQEGTKYLIVDSDSNNAPLNIEGREGDVTLRYEDKQGSTSACGDNALIFAKVAKQMGYDPSILIIDSNGNKHAVCVIPHSQSEDPEALYKVILNTPMEQGTSFTGLLTSSIESMYNGLMSMLPESLMQASTEDLDTYQLLLWSLEDALGMTAKGFFPSYFPGKPDDDYSDFGKGEIAVPGDSFGLYGSNVTQNITNLGDITSVE